MDEKQEFMIRQIVDGEEYYLKAVETDRLRDLLLEEAFGRKMSRKKKTANEKKAQDPNNQNVTATWTKDETKAMYFRSMKEAEKVIRKWKELRNGTIISA